MTGGGFTVDSNGYGVNARLTASVVITCIVAASGGLIFGYDIGISVYLSETAPSKWRGAFNTGFQLFIGIGVLAANVLNFFSAKLYWGWRLSLGLAAAPAIIMGLCALLISDTPSSLVQRGKLEEARRSLLRIRGVESDIEAELNDLVKASEATRAVNEEPFKTIFERQYRPHLVMAVAIPFFQQLTGINIIAFYAPVLFQSVGFGSDSALLSAIILGSVNLTSILVSTFIVDRYGRKILFMEGGIQMVVCQVSGGTLLNKICWINYRGADGVLGRDKIMHSRLGHVGPIPYTFCVWNTYMLTYDRLPSSLCTILFLSQSRLQLQFLTNRGSWQSY
uniref:Major facilitator superfamily (MFS) profile domain-containing protein n=1 Tax=Nelumbo nucifera TaxID=4432 RepID=A0A822XQI7_NELNU|nr:TPA_asm: hypothetical protein HUJ06_023406 [Nelumbo nucifera]